MAWQEKLPDAVKWGLVPYTRGLGLEVGCGPHRTFPHFVGVDALPNTRLFGSPVQPDVVVKTVSSLPGFTSGAWDFVFAPKHPNGTEEVALAEWWRLIKAGGHLCLYGPDREREMQALKGWEMVHEEAVQLCTASGDTETNVLQVYRKLHGAEHRQGRVTCRGPKPAKTCAVVRLGAFGDMIQASSILPALKEQGYHVTVYTATRGYDVVKHDPHIDAFVLQDPDQVPIHELGEFWKWLKGRYTRFINLSESVEGSLLAVPGTAAHGWPHELRHALMNVNYLEMAHGVAGVPFPPRQKFYPTDVEAAWARKERQKMGGAPVILWTLSGSSIHKAWPYLDQTVARTLLEWPNARVVLVGDELSKTLEQGWEAEPRVLRRSGEWTIRQTLAFIEQADLLVGPETGVMNAAGLHPVKKVVTLSHSSEENLTKHWKNCVALTPKNTACYPCHQMHYSSEFCPRDEKEGVAKCQADISVDAMWEAMKSHLKLRAVA